SLRGGPGPRAGPAAHRRRPGCRPPSARGGGWRGAPALAGGRVPLVLELLSPARRPAAVTADLGCGPASVPRAGAEVTGASTSACGPAGAAAGAPAATGAAGVTG